MFKIQEELVEEGVQILGEELILESFAEAGECLIVSTTLALCGRMGGQPCMSAPAVVWHAPVISVIKSVCIFR